MKKKLKITSLAISIVAIFANFVVIRLSANGPGSIEPDAYVGPCYQSMGYCDMTLTYRCQTSQTSEACRLHACWNCKESISLPTY